MPVDHIKHQAALEHFGFQVSRVFLPFRRFSHAEASFLTLTLEGYQPAQRVVRLDESIRLDLSLEKSGQPAQTRAVGRPKKRVGKESTIDPFSE